MKRRSLKSYEDAALDALAGYYDARKWCRQHPKSALQRDIALRARQTARAALTALIAEESELGLRGFPQ